jgi:hypothetical protein
MVPKPQTELLIPKKSMPAPSAEKTNVEASSSTSQIPPDHIEDMDVERESDSVPGTHRKSVTLADEFIHFLKTTNASSEEEIMEFMIPAANRRTRAGLGVNAPMEPIVTEENNRAQDVPFTRSDFHSLLKKAATTPVQKPAPKAK